MVAGGPGVGKSRVTKSLRRLFDALGWVQAQHYQFAAFQAVVANQLGGDTLHHSCSVTFGNQRRTDQQKAQTAPPCTLPDINAI